MPTSDSSLRLCQPDRASDLVRDIQPLLHCLRGRCTPEDTIMHLTSLRIVSALLYRESRSVVETFRPVDLC